MNTCRRINSEWLFFKQPLSDTTTTLSPTPPAQNDSRFYPVNLPHDWLIANSADHYENSEGWYQKIISSDILPFDASSDDDWLLYFEGKGVELLGCDDLKLIAERAQAELKDVNNKITALRLKMGFLQEKVEQYRKLAKTLEQQKAVDKQAEAAAQSIRQQLAGAEGQLQELKKQLAEQNELLTDVDEQKLQQEHEKLLVQQRELELQDKRLYAAIKNNQRIKQEVSGYEARRAACEAEYSLINSLSATLNGTLTGKKRVNLETYVQMHYLDKILQRANVRLLHMSRGQYELCRDKMQDADSKTGNSKTGLDLEVKDYYSGNLRSVKTLSGGESFMASLA